MSPNREAERLRIIIESLAYTSPEMSMDEAAKAIFEIEQRTHELEARENPAQGIELRDTQPETLACLIDLVPEIQRYLPDRKINGIKELRARVLDPTTGSGVLGLKDAKDGIEHWVATRTPTVGLPAPMAPHMLAGAGGPAGAYPTSSSSSDIADWIEARQPSLLDYAWGVHKGLAGFNKINFIKDIRMESSCGLKESKDGAEELLSRIAHGKAAPPPV